MRNSSEAMIVVGAIVLAALIAPGQDARQEWKLTRSDTPDMVHFRVERSQRSNHSSHSSDVPLANFRGLSLDRSGPATFQYVHDAGSLQCTGRFSFGAGSGTFTVTPNPQFSADLTSLGYAAPDDEQLFTMMLTNVNLEFARGVRDAGLRASTSQLIELRIHGVTLHYVRETQKLGYSNLSARDYVELKIHGVSTEFLRDLRQAGYDLSAGQVTELKIHGVSSEYMRELKAYGLQPPSKDLVQLKIHGVSPEYLKALKDAGYSGMSVNQITELKIHGVSPEFVREARDMGYQFASRDLVELKIHGVDGAYLKRLRDSGMRDLSASQITKLKIHGVD